MSILFEGYLQETAAEMKRWLQQIRETAVDLDPHSRQSLATLGLQMAGLNAPDAFRRCATPEACAALDELEAALGVISTEAYRSLLAAEKRPSLPAAIVPQSPSFDVAAMTALLDRDHPNLRQRVRRLLTDPVFAHRPHPDKTEYRERVLDWTRILARQGLGALAYPPEFGGAGEIAQYLTVMETLSHHDLSLVIKFGVQFGLFGGSIALLGTEKHHQKYLRDVGSLALPGCFAMTELGHGSNVRDLETMARYERETAEFVIHTPTLSARKEYIGNAAAHGRLATVFAQLEIDGERYGVNAFLVPIRDENGQPLPGVTIEDNGEKMGLNGVDNGRLSFDQVRVPRQNMLDRFAAITADGAYVSDIAGESRRFFTMIGTLVGGRVGVARAALAAAKTGLTIAIRYARRRRQFGPEGAPETLLLDYQTHQERLLPHLATAYALDFALKYLTDRYAQRSDADSREVEALAAGLKAYTTWFTTRVLQESREACGAQGYMAVNRFADLKADSDIFTTFEGDNTVLMQLVAKSRLTRFQQQFHDDKLFGLVKFIAGQAATTLIETNPIVTRRTDPHHLREPDSHRGEKATGRDERPGAAAGRCVRHPGRGAGRADCADVTFRHPVQFDRGDGRSVAFFVAHFPVTVSLPSRFRKTAVFPYILIIMLTGPFLNPKGACHMNNQLSRLNRETTGLKLFPLATLAGWVFIGILVLVNQAMLHLMKMVAA